MEIRNLSQSTTSRTCICILRHAEIMIYDIQFHSKVLLTTEITKQLYRNTDIDLDIDVKHHYTSLKY